MKDKNNKKNEEKAEVSKEKTEQEIQDDAKRIADMEAKIIALENENKTYKEAAEKLVAECNKKLAQMDASYQDAYKGQMLLKEKQAQEQIKAKLAELEAKAKEELAIAKKYAIKDQALDLINIITQFDKACNYPLSDPKLANYQRGFQIFLTQFNNLLSDLHIEKIVPEIGKEFDANTMQCFEETIKDPSKPDGTIVEVIYPGYKLHDRLLQPALVKVVKNN